MITLYRRGGVISIFKELFHENSIPKILYEIESDSCILNRYAIKLFPRKNNASIFDIFPHFTISTHPTEGPFTDVWGNIHIIQCDPIDKEHIIINIDKDNFLNWTHFVKYKKIFHKISLLLYECESENDLFKKVVEEAKKKLDFDRVGILLFSLEKDLLQGTWGTDTKGNLICENNFTSNLNENKWIIDAINNEEYVVVNYGNLWTSGDKTGLGWNARSLFFSDNNPIGWIACDNYINHKPLPPWKIEILGEIGRTLSQVISRLRQQQKLQKQVNEQTAELKKSQESLIEAEKMASLGTLVAGISHELNTPIGIALTSASFISEQTELIRKTIETNSIKKTELIHFLNNNLQSGKLTVSALKRASKLINNFKKLAVDNKSEEKIKLSPYELVDIIYKSIQYKYNNIEVEFSNRIKKNLHINTYIGDMTQIFTNLIDNSYNHGFKERSTGSIIVDSKVDDENLTITYQDNGIGVQHEDFEVIFDPFFTTARNRGNTGLGLTIVYNLVVKLGGKIEIKPNKSGFSIDLVFKTKIMH